MSLLKKREKTYNYLINELVDFENYSKNPTTKKDTVRTILEIAISENPDIEIYEGVYSQKELSKWIEYYLPIYYSDQLELIDQLSPEIEILKQKESYKNKILKNFYNFMSFCLLQLFKELDKQNSKFLGE